MRHVFLGNSRLPLFNYRDIFLKRAFRCASDYFACLRKTVCPKSSTYDGVQRRYGRWVIL